MVEALERTLAELEVLGAIYGVDDDDDVDDVEGATNDRFKILTPQTTMDHADSIVVENDMSAADVSIPNLEIEITTTISSSSSSSTTVVVRIQCCLPKGYPETVPAQVKDVSFLTGTGSKDPRGHAAILLREELNKKAVSLVGSEAIMELIESLKEIVAEQLEEEEEVTAASDVVAAADTTTTSNNDNDNPQQQQSGQQHRIYVITTHHLLDHSPDNYLSKGGSKHKLMGYYKYGTPGLAIIIICGGGDGRDDVDEDVEDFKTTLEKKMPQKKFQLLALQQQPPPPEQQQSQNVTTGWEETTNNLDPIRQLLTPEDFSTIFNIQGKGGGAANNNNNNSKGKNQNGSKKTNNKKNKK